MKLQLKIFTALFICLQPISIFAQVDTKDLDKVDIFTQYKPVLSDARRVESQPELKEPDFKSPKLDYSFPDLRYKVKPAFTPIAAMPYRVTPNPFMKNNFIKAGFGNYSTPLLHLELHNGKSNNYAYGLNAFHLSSTGKPKYKSFMDDHIQVHGSKFMNGNTLRGQLSYSRNGFNYYGYDHTMPETDFKKDSVKQALNNVTGNVHFDNYQTPKRVKTGFDFDIYRFSTNEQNELGYKASNKTSGKIANGVMELNTAFEGMVSGPDSVEYSRNYIDINPVYRMRYKEVDLTLGAISCIVFDSAKKNTFYLYPQFRAEYYVVPEKMKAFAGIGGGITKGSTRALYLENPFLAENQLLRNINTTYIINAGIKGKLGKNFDYTLELSQQFIYNLPLYVSDSNVLHKFIVVYDKVKLFKFSAGLNYSKFDKINLGTNFTYFGYKGEDETQAYQRPDFEWNTLASFLLSKKLAIHGKFYIIGTRYAKENNSSKVEKLAPIADINIGADYRFKKNISFFLDFNNLTNQTYQRWNNYRSYGLNILGGVTFSL